MNTPIVNGRKNGKGDFAELLFLSLSLFLTLLKMSCPQLETLRGHFTSCIHIINHVQLFFMASSGLGPKQSRERRTAFIVN